LLAAVAGLQDLASLVDNEASSRNSKEYRFAIAGFDLDLLPHLVAVSGVDAGEYLAALMQCVIDGYPGSAGLAIVCVDSLQHFFASKDA
jgi:hypothetical protein